MTRLNQGRIETGGADSASRAETRAPGAAAPSGGSPALSIVIPAYDEAGNVGPLLEEVRHEADALGRSYEIVVVNDGSRDGTDRALDELARRDARIRVIHFASNFGQTAALAAGLEAAAGDVIITMDGDRQNDPSEMRRLIEKLEEGYACVSGWRRDRHDDALRSFASRAANRMISKATSLPLHDYGCTLKAYRRDALDPSQLYGEMHRFLPVYVRARGGAVAEIVVRHRPRVVGVSKYGFSRIPRVLADLALVRLLFKYRTRPSHLFAKVAGYLVAAGALVGGYGVVRGLGKAPILDVPLLLAAVLGVGSLILVGIGLCCELVMRNHFYVLGRRPWRIARTVNLPDAAGAASAQVRTSPAGSAQGGAAF
ncbi:MAG: Dodecaprenyl-phosphate galacturonate synthase [Phycisphaerae bacterium]|nr:Dodecaprenyl-phosphate galacturonate synthase [Phycisphaerae bacterium]